MGAKTLASPIQPSRSSRCGQSVMTLWRLPRRPHRVFSKILLTSGEEVSTVPAGGASECSTSPVSAVGSGVPGKPVISTYRNPWYVNRGV